MNMQSGVVSRKAESEVDGLVTPEHHIKGGKGVEEKSGCAETIMGTATSLHSRAANVSGH